MKINLKIKIILISALICFLAFFIFLICINISKPSHQDDFNTFEKKSKTAPVYDFQKILKTDQFLDTLEYDKKNNIIAINRDAFQYELINDLIHSVKLYDLQINFSYPTPLNADCQIIYKINQESKSFTSNISFNFVKYNKF